MSSLTPKDELKAILLGAIDVIQANLAKQEIGDSYAPRPANTGLSPSQEFQDAINQKNKTIANDTFDRGLEIFVLLNVDDQKAMYYLLNDVAQIAGRDLEKELSEVKKQGLFKDDIQHEAPHEQEAKFLPDYFKGESIKAEPLQTQPTKDFLPSFGIDSRTDSQEIDDVEKKQPEPDLEPDKED